MSISFTVFGLVSSVPMWEKVSRNDIFLCHVLAPASDQAYDHALRHRQQQKLGSKKTAKHVVDSGNHDDRIQARTGDVTTSSSGPGRPGLVLSSLMKTVLLSCVILRTTLVVDCVHTTLT